MLASGCGRGSPPRPPDIVLVVIDTLRADHLGAYGYPRPTSPVFDSLAAKGALFENATASSSWTRPSVASLFTSRLPSEHGAVASLAPLDAGVATLAELLRDAGYRTVGVSGNFPHVNEKSGLARGFQSFVSLALPARGAGSDPLMRLPLKEGAPLAAIRAPTAAEVNERVVQALAKAPERPLFLYVHYMDPHAGYLAPEPFRSRFRSPGAAAGPAATSDYVVELSAGRVAPPPGERERLIDLYDAEIAYVDSQLGRLLGDLERADVHVGDGAVLVVLADHGEEFDDHGGWFHGRTLYREMLRVPLLVVGAPPLAPGVRRDPVELLDVPTSLLSLAGVSPAPGMRGHLLWDEGSPHPRIAELQPDPVREDKAGARVHQLAVDSWPWTAVADPDGHVSLYQLEEDPDERTPLPAAAPGAPGGLVALARARLREMAAARAVPDRAPTPEEREALRALGYAK